MADKERTRLPYEAVKSTINGLKQAGDQKVEQNSRRRTSTEGSRDERGWWTK